MSVSLTLPFPPLLSIFSIHEITLYLHDNNDVILTYYYTNIVDENNVIIWVVPIFK